MRATMKRRLSQTSKSYSFSNCTTNCGFALIWFLLDGLEICYRKEIFLLEWFGLWGWWLILPR